MQDAEYVIEATPAKNRIYMKLKGFLSDDQVQAAADKFLDELKNLKPGIDIINDISEFKPASARGAEIIQNAQKQVAQLGVRKLVRIVDNRVLGLLQFKTTSKGAGYDGVTVHSLAEAEKYLESGS